MTYAREKRPAWPPGARSRRIDGQSSSRGKFDFATVNAAARANLLPVLERWLPDGSVHGREYVARNPKREDHHPGSFSINLRNGKWADFATGDRGGDPISLAAYLFDLKQVEAARRLADMLGVSVG